MSRYIGVQAVIIASMLVILTACGASDEEATATERAIEVMSLDAGVALPDPGAGEDDDPRPQAGSNGMDEPTGGCNEAIDDGHFYSFSAQPMGENADSIPMCQYRDRVLLIVNTAALCGFSPQYAQLQALQDRYGDSGFEVLGFLSNDFGDQVGSSDQIEECETIYGLTFQQFSQIGVLPLSRPEQHPIYEWLTRQEGFEGDIEWNFVKFLVDGTGHVVGRWGSLTVPDAPEIIDAIETALGSWP